MTEEQRKDLLEILEATLQKVKEEPGYGKKLLVNAGILNQDGTFTEHYKTLEMQDPK
jgi:hypothetical protein